MKIIKDHIPHNTDHNRRPGYSMKPSSITVHSTGNPNSTAKNERGWLTNSSNKRTASYHYVVDDTDFIECIPPDENAWHAGDGGSGPGNRTSIGVEICESGYRAKALANAVKLIAHLMQKHNITKVVRHYDWNKKICPRIMYDGGSWNGWNNFKNRVMDTYNGEERKEDNKDYSTYTIKKGDTFWGIAQSKEVTVKQLKEYNPNVNPNALKVGQVISLKPTVTKKEEPKQEDEYPLPSGILRRGSSGYKVKQLQRALNTVYFKVGAVDGSYGPKTEDAIERFQSVYLPYEIDGVYGPNTKRELRKKLNE